MMNYSDQSRGEWPSASAALPNKLCPARHLACLPIPEPPPSPEAEAGTAIHAAWCGKPIRPLTPAEEEVLEGLREREGEIAQQWRGDDKTELEVHREHRLWHGWDPGPQRPCLQCSGQADVFYMAGHRALIIDGKSGHKAAPTEAENLQLRWLATLITLNYPAVTEVTVALAQHWQPKSPPCVYGLNDLARAVEEMEQQVEACYASDAPRIAGEVQCEHCRAKKNCSAFSTSGLPVPFIPPRVPKPTDLGEAIAGMNGYRLGLFLSLCRLAEQCATQEVRRRLEDNIEVDGWRLLPGRGRETITNPQGVFERFVLAGGKTEDFLTAVQVQKGKLKDAVRVATGTKGKTLDAQMDKMLEGLTETTVSKPVLEHV